MKPKRKVDIAIVAEDGVESLVCGVGMIVSHFIAGFEEIRDILHKQNISASLSIAHIGLPKGSPGYNQNLLEKTQKIVRDTKGYLYRIEPNRLSSDNYFQPKLWLSYCKQAREVINGRRKSNQTTLVIHHDTILAGIPNSNTDFISCWIPHSLADVHKQRYADNDARLLWEQASLNHILKNKTAFVGAISPHAKELLKDLNIPKEKLVATNNGFNFKILDTHKLKLLDIKAQILAAKIPVNKLLVVTYARADEYKNLDNTFLAMLMAAKKTGTHPVCIASPFSEEEFIDKVQEKLKKISKRYDGIPHTLILDYEFALPKILVQWPQTKTLVVCPRRDFSPIIPFEAAYLGHPHLRYVLSNKPFFTENLPPNCAELTATDSQSIANAILKTANISDNAAKAFKTTLTKFTKNNYNVIENYTSSILKLLERTNL